MSLSDFADAAGTTWVFKNTLKASLSKLMWDTRATAGAYHERDRGQQFLMDVLMARHDTIDGRANDALH